MGALVYCTSSSVFRLIRQFLSWWHDLFLFQTYILMILRLLPLHKHSCIAINWCVTPDLGPGPLSRAGGTILDRWQCHHPHIPPPSTRLHSASLLLGRRHPTGSYWWYDGPLYSSQGHKWMLVPLLWELFATHKSDTMKAASTEQVDLIILPFSRGILLFCIVIIKGQK